MTDPRVTKLAELLCTHSTSLSADDTVLIHAIDIPDTVVAEVVRVARSKGAQVVMRLESNRVKRQLMMGMTEENVKTIADIEMYEMKQMSAYISIRGSDNVSEAGDVPDEVMTMWSRNFVQPVVLGERVPNTKWVALRWPSPSMAQQAGMSTDAFEEFYFDVCTMDYPRMQKAAEPLRELMLKTDRVEIKGPGTDIAFSIKDIDVRQSYGLRNIPDGECFTSPVRDSVNGVLQYNTVSLYQGTEFKDVRIVCKDGKVVECDAGDQTRKMNEILDTDEGARYFGEWALGYNPYVMHPMKDTLFDEKIGGSFHMTPGNAYDDADNGNRSAVHWDIVCIQRPEYGGGEVLFDGVVIRKDGLFVLPELEGLNPENLR
ncbi:MAG: aminopeptidase [Armatimonadetes bacterium]|nr:aminopeptidase [Armatimonadota bacterium]